MRYRECYLIDQIRADREQIQILFSVNLGFGMTEASPVTHATPANGFVIGSCGVAVPNTLTKIIDIETGEPIGPNEGEGELCVKGPQVTHLV